MQNVRFVPAGSATQCDGSVSYEGLKPTAIHRAELKVVVFFSGGWEVMMPPSHHLDSSCSRS